MESKEGYGYDQLFDEVCDYKEIILDERQKPSYYKT